MGTHPRSEAAPITPDQVTASLRRSDGPLGKAKRAEILALGSAAIPPLVQLLEEEASGLEQGSRRAPAPAALHAVSLLGELAAEAAIPVLLRLLGRLDALAVLYSALLDSLRRIGPAAGGPALEELARAREQLAGGPGDPDDHHAAAAREQLEDWHDGLLELLSQLEVKDERIFQALLARLDARPGLVSSYLGRYGDPRALPLLARRFEALTGDFDSPDPRTWQLHELREVAGAIEQLGGTLTPEQQGRLEQALAPVRQHRQQLAAGARARSLADLGRNDPCPCGSGAKFKKCHLGREAELERSG